MTKTLIACLFCVQTALAQTVFRPIADGNVYVTGAVNESGILVPGPTIHAIVMFAAFDVTPGYQYSLEVNLYSLPIGANTINVYGFDSSDGVIRGTQFDAGTFLGNFVLPSNLGYGQSVSLDVSSFVLAAPDSYWAFNLRASAGDGLSSLEQNYGHPTEIVASIVPEPPPLALLFITGCFLGVFGLAERDWLRQRHFPSD